MSAVPWAPASRYGGDEHDGRRHRARSGGFACLIDKTGEFQRRPYDWSVEVSKLSMPVLLVFADADSMPPS